MTRIAFVYFDAGGGHRSTATSVRDEMCRRDPASQPELVNLQELLDPIDLVRRLTGIRVQDVYNRMLQNEWTLGSPQLMRVLQALIRLYHRPTVALLAEHWRRAQFDMIVSFVPHFNRALCESFAVACPGRPFVTLLTDFADYPPHFWIERQKQIVICGTEQAVQQARQMDHADECIFRTSGMVLNPRFYQLTELDRVRERRKLGLDPQRATGIVLFGGHGAWKAMMKIDRLLGASSLPIQLILICGRNDALKRALQKRRCALPRFIEGFTTQVPYYMQLSDFFIGKPGPGSVAEALAMKLPVIVERNAWTLPQERYNTEWIREHQAGLVVRRFDDIVEAVSKLLDRLPEYCQHVATTENRALFEAVEILKTLAGGAVNRCCIPQPVPSASVTTG